MMMSKMIDVALLALLVFGFAGAASVSYANATGNPCPHLVVVPICYVVLVAYGLMIAAVAIPNNACKHYFFCVGWGTAFVIALVGSLAELAAGGGVCPTTGGGSLRGASGGSVPLCFASLAMLVVILVLFLKGPYGRACKACENAVAASA